MFPAIPYGVFLIVNGATCLFAYYGGRRDERILQHRAQELAQKNTNTLLVELVKGLRQPAPVVVPPEEATANVTAMRAQAA